MNYLHTKTSPVIHGDLKIQNVLIAEHYKAKVANSRLNCSIFRRMLLCYPLSANVTMNLLSCCLSLSLLHSTHKV